MTSRRRPGSVRFPSPRARLNRATPSIRHLAFLGAALLFAIVSGVAWGDQVVLKNGNAIDGVILEETETYVRIRPAQSSATHTLKKDMIEKVVREEGVTLKEREGDQRLVRREYEAARQLYRDAVKETAAQKGKERLKEKIDKCTKEIVKQNKAELDQISTGALELLRRSGFNDLRKATEFVRDATKQPKEGVAKKDIERVVAMLYYAVAKNEMDRYKYDAAYGAIQTAIQHADDLAILFLTLGDLNIKMGGLGQYDAIDNYKKGLELAGDQLPAKEQGHYYYEVGRLLLQKGELPKAVEYLLKSIALAPEQHAEARSYAATAFLKILDSEPDLMANSDAKIARLQQLIGLNTDPALIVKMKEILANIYMIRKDCEKAIETLREILQTFPSRLNVHFRIAQCYEELSGKAKTSEEAFKILEEAEKEYGSEIKVNPSNYEAYCSEAEIMSRTQRFSDARTLLERAIELDPVKWRAFSLIMHVEKRLGDSVNVSYHDKAIEHAQKLVELRGQDHPEFFDAIMLKASILIQRAQYDEAEMMLKEVIEPLEKRGVATSGVATSGVATLSPIEGTALASAYNGRGFIAQERDGQLHVAEREYQRAIDINKNNADAFGLLGEVLKRLATKESAEQARKERFKKAEEAFSKAIELDPFNPDRHQALGLFYYRDLKDFEKALAELQKYQKMGGAAADKIIADIQRAIH